MQVSEAGLADVLATLPALAPAWTVKAMVLQHAGSRAFVFQDDDGRLAAIAGLYALPEPKTAELWLIAGPALRDNLPALLRAARLTLGRAADDGVVVRATVAAGRSPGARLARLAGFRQVAASGAVETWEAIRGEPGGGHPAIVPRP